jgi:hypothetical protein
MNNFSEVAAVSIAWEKLGYCSREHEYRYAGRLTLDGGREIGVELGYIGTRAGQVIKWYRVKGEGGQDSYDTGLNASEYRRMSSDFLAYINGGSR